MGRVGQFWQSARVSFLSAYFVDKGLTQRAGTSSSPVSWSLGDNIRYGQCGHCGRKTPGANRLETFRRGRRVAVSVDERAVFLAD